jgi:rRNA maturation endonuclease Nob1
MKTKGLRLRQCHRCNKLYQGTKYSKLCKECYHPSGTLGKILKTKVGGVMATFL